MNLTGREIDVGQSPFDLAEYAKDANTTRKLYINDAKDMYVEVNVKSKQLDEEGSGPKTGGKLGGPTNYGTGLSNIASNISQSTKNIGQSETPRYPRNKNEPETEEDKMLMDDFIRREEEYKKQIAQLKKEKEDVNNQNLQI